MTGERRADKRFLRHSCAEIARTTNPDGSSRSDGVYKTSAIRIEVSPRPARVEGDLYRCHCPVQRLDMANLCGIFMWPCR